VVWPTGHEPQLQWWFLFRKYVITRMRVARAELSMIYLAGWDFEIRYGEQLLDTITIVKSRWRNTYPGEYPPNRLRTPPRDTSIKSHIFNNLRL
jgi:hypothetical protein